MERFSRHLSTITLMGIKLMILLRQARSLALEKGAFEGSHTLQLDLSRHTHNKSGLGVIERQEGQRRANATYP